MSLDRKILERIERENLVIRPRWFFAMKDILFGAGTLFLSILSSLSLALLFEIIKQQGKNLTWLNISYAWIILLGIFLVASYWLVTKIDSLYKIKFVPIVSMLFFISLSFGYLTFASGKAEKIELELEKIPIYDIIMPISKEKDTSLNVVEKTESSNENMNVNDEDKKNDDDIKEDSKSMDSDENDKVNIRESNFKVEIKEENEDDEIKELEKTGNIDEDEDEDKDEDEDEDDTLKGEVKGVSKEINKDEDEEIEEEKSDSDDEISEDNLEESETDSPDTVDED